VEIIFLGTAAAEGIPALFCECEICKEAQRRGGKNIRMRSAVILANRLLIDFGPDMFYQKIKNNLDFSHLKHVLITHSHSDHFDTTALWFRHNPFCHINGDKMMTIYGNEKVEKYFSYSLSGEENKPYIEFKRVYREQTFYADDIQITPLLARHAPDEECFVYYIEIEGKKVFYGNDSGIYPDSTIEFLKGKNLDLVIFDSNTAKHRDGKYHMGILDNVEVYERFKGQGTVNDNTKVVMTHFSHNGQMLHEELEIEAQKYGFIVAYDSLKLEI